MTALARAVHSSGRMSQLDPVVAGARRAIQDHPLGDLALGWRRRIWAAMGPRENGEARRRRAHLAIGTAESVLPLWERRFVHDPRPRQLLEHGRLLLPHVGSPTFLPRPHWDVQIQAWQYFADYPVQSEEAQLLSGVGFAATQALATILDDEWFDEENDPTLQDQDVAVTDKDASFFACASYAGGAVWNHARDPTEVPPSRERRAAFWQAWLDRATAAVRGSGPSARSPS